MDKLVCPYCDIPAKLAIATGSADQIKACELVPVLCSDCLKVYVLRYGIIGKITEEEVDRLQGTSAWEYIQNSMSYVNAVYNSRKAHTN